MNEPDKRAKQTNKTKQNNPKLKKYLMDSETHMFEHMQKSPKNTLEPIPGFKSMVLGDSNFLPFSCLQSELC